MTYSGRSADGSTAGGTAGHPAAERGAPLAAGDDPVPIGAVIDVEGELVDVVVVLDAGGRARLVGRGLARSSVDPPAQPLSANATTASAVAIRGRHHDLALGVEGAVRRPILHPDAWRHV
jgi:hypothetical protein